VEYCGGRAVQVVGDKEIAKEKKERSTQFEGGWLVSEISSLVLERYVERRVVNDNVVISTTNRDMAMIRNMFLEGKDMHGLEPPKFPIDPSAEHERTVTITLEQERLLLAALVDEEIVTCTRKGKTYQTKSHCKRAYLRPIVIAAIDTALRAGELRKITWDKVDLDKQVITIMYWIAKVPKTREVPISDRLKTELEKMPDRTGQVFLKLGDYKRSWGTALKRAGIPKGTRFHDLRHTGTTQMVESGVPVPIAMKITGHTQNKTFNRYVNPSTAAIQNAGKQLQEWRRQQEQVVIDAESTAVN
jgi:integrase